MLESLSKNAKITLSILFIFLGIILIFFTYFQIRKDNVFERKYLMYMEQIVTLNVELQELVVDPNIEEDEKVTVSSEGRYDYIGYLNVPDVNINKGFVALNSPYNHVNYNVMLINGSDMPDVNKGNLILAGHNGSSSVSYFTNLYKLELGANATITYKNKEYTYKLVDVYDVPKVGTVEIKRDGEKNTLTLITCKRNSKTEQTVFIFELI